MYNVDMKNIVPKESLTCLVAKAILDESILWHRRLSHVNFKTINKLLKENLVRGLPTKHFENDQTCVACLKGKQHKASSTKDETSGILKSFITEVKNLVDKKVKIIRCDNGTEFKNRVMSEFCEKKGIKKEFSVARTPQQNSVAERRNRTLIEAARTMLADSNDCWRRKDDEGVCNESGIADHERPENSTQGVNTARPSINTEPYMFSMGDNATLEVTHADLFGGETEVNLSNITTTYPVPLPSKSRIIKDHYLIIWDVKSAFLCIGKIEEEVMSGNLLGFLNDPEFLTEFIRFHRGTIDKTLFIKKVKGDILLVQVYVDDIIFGSTKKELCTEFKKLMHKKFQMSSMASTPMETTKPLLRDVEAEDVNVHLYRSMIRSLMYLTASRPNIICLKGQPKLGLWYPKDSPFDLEAYTDSDYVGASLDRKSTTGGCQFLKSRLISWQCKKQTIVANSTTEADKIFIDNESTICIVKNPVFHSKTKHIKIRHHFIMDSNEKKLIQMINIYTDQNVADLLTKAFDVGRFQYLIAKANDKIQVSVVGLTYFCNMKRDFKGFTREDIPLFPTMLVQSLVVQGEGSTHPVESHHTPISAPSTSQPLISSTSRRTTRQESVVPQPRSPTQTHVADEAASTGLDVRYGGATTTITSLEARQSSGNIDKTPTMPNDSPPPRVNTLRSDEGIMSLQELMVLCTTLSKKVESLETNLKQAKQIYGVAYTKLIKKDMEFETDFDAAKEVSTAEDVSIAKPVSIVGAIVTTASVITTSPTKVSTADDNTLAETLVYIRRSAAKDKGKGKMDESEPVQTKTKLQQEHERLGYEAAVRLQDELEEEERQRIASVHESASSFNIEEWEDIQARIQADEEFVQRLQEEEIEKYTKA
ncbi:putative ribonuclease H-like domain-containing protein [Tanacetum coccineum]